MTPFAAYVREPLNLAPNPDEVDEILRVPFSIFQDNRTLRVETRVRLGVERKVYFYDFQGKEVWGLTAQVIRDLMQCSTVRWRLRAVSVTQHDRPG